MRRTARSAAKTTRKVRATFHLPHELFEEARDAVVQLSGPPVRLTLAALAETALRRELDRLKRAHNQGEAFPRRRVGLRGGRPIGS
jgi:post-segregation antitoxin (ccd killing protein)